MIFAGSIGTVLALAVLSAWHASVEALAVLFLALALLAVAALTVMLDTLELMADVLPGLADLVLVVLVIRAAVAGALIRAHFALPEALAVHLEAFCLFAGAPVFLFFGDGSRGHHLVLSLLDLVIDGELILLLVEELLGDVLVKADGGVEGEVLLGLDKLQGMSDVWDRWQPEETLAQ